MTIMADPEFIKPRLIKMNGTTRHGMLETVTVNSSQTDKDAVMNRLPGGVKVSTASDLVIDTDRMEKVANLKHLIQAGHYQPDLERVAKSLLNYIMTDHC
jgi:anti-sigma28 factor (negative regulator of flagellin synthesis)